MTRHRQPSALSGMNVDTLNISALVSASEPLLTPINAAPQALNHEALSFEKTLAETGMRASAQTETNPAGEDLKSNQNQIALATNITEPLVLAKAAIVILRTAISIAHVKHQSSASANLDPSIAEPETEYVVSEEKYLGETPIEIVRSANFLESNQKDNSRNSIHSDMPIFLDPIIIAPIANNARTPTHVDGEVSITRDLNSDENAESAVATTNLQIAAENETAVMTELNGNPTISLTYIVDEKRALQSGTLQDGGFGQIASSVPSKTYKGNEDEHIHPSQDIPLTLRTDTTARFETNSPRIESDFDEYATPGKNYSYTFVSNKPAMGTQVRFKQQAAGRDRPAAPEINDLDTSIITRNDISENKYDVVSSEAVEQNRYSKTIPQASRDMVGTDKTGNTDYPDSQKMDDYTVIPIDLMESDESDDKFKKILTNEVINKRASLESNTPKSGGPTPVNMNVDADTDYNKVDLNALNLSLHSQLHDLKTLNHALPDASIRDVQSSETLIKTDNDASSELATIINNSKRDTTNINSFPAQSKLYHLIYDNTLTAEDASSISVHAELADTIGDQSTDIETKHVSARMPAEENRAFSKVKPSDQSAGKYEQNYVQSETIQILPETDAQNADALSSGRKAISTPTKNSVEFHKNLGVTSLKISEDLRLRALERQVINAVREGADQVRMQLYPPGLGQVIIKIALEGSRLRLQIRTSTSEAAASLTDIKDLMRASLGDSGFMITSIDISKEKRDPPPDGRQRQHKPEKEGMNSGTSEFNLDVHA